MYKKFTGENYKKFLELDPSYSIEGFVVYGTYKKEPYQMLRDSFSRLGINVKFNRLEHEFLQDILEFEVGGKKYWFVVAYGGAILSEYLHLACLFGNKKSLLLGACGGLKSGASSRDIVIPEWSYAEESSAKAYQSDANNKYEADEALSDKLAKTLSENYQVHRGPTVTYQAMMAETWQDVQNWTKQGYIGVEMESATVFAASKHFNVPAAAVLRIADNLIEEETVMSESYENSQDEHKKIAEVIFDTAIQELVS